MNLNGAPSVRFNVANNFLVGPSATFAWIAAVATHPGNGGAATFPNFSALLQRDAASSFLVGNQTTADWATGGSAIAGTRFRNGATTNVALTAVNAGHYYEFTPNTPAAGAFRIGGNNSSTVDWLGTVAEVFGGPSVPSSIDLLALLGYVQARYGTP